VSGVLHSDLLAYRLPFLPTPSPSPCAAPPLPRGRPHRRSGLVFLTAFFFTRSWSLLRPYRRASQGKPLEVHGTLYPHISLFSFMFFLSRPFPLPFFFVTLFGRLRFFLHAPPTNYLPSSSFFRSPLFFILLAAPPPARWGTDRWPRGRLLSPFLLFTS